MWGPVTPLWELPNFIWIDRRSVGPLGWSRIRYAYCRPTHRVGFTPSSECVTQYDRMCGERIKRESDHFLSNILDDRLVSMESVNRLAPFSKARAFPRLTLRVLLLPYA